MVREERSADDLERAPPRRPTSLRWLVSGSLPPLTAALLVGERLQAAVLGASARAVGGVPEELACHEADGLPVGHRHPFYLPEDADDDGWIDHLVLHAPKGLAPAWRFALGRVRPAAAWEGDLARFTLTGDWIGSAARERAPGTLLGAARVWRSLTPYVPDLHLKPRFGVIDALERELARPHLPPPLTIEPLPALPVAGSPLEAAMFASRRTGGGKRIARSRHPGGFFRLTFARPVRGPLALGFASHLGLGLFRRDGDLLGPPRASL